MYERKLDLMDETVFPLQTRYAQNENPKMAITTDVKIVPQNNETIIEFVTNEMKDTLG